MHTIYSTWPFRRCLLSSVFALSALLSAGCNSPGFETTSRSDSLLVVVLADLYLNEAEYQLSVAAIPDSTDANPFSVHQPDSQYLPPVFAGVRASVLAEHDLTEQSFQDRIQPYLQHPEQLQSLYDRVLDHLNLERQRLQGQ